MRPVCVSMAMSEVANRTRQPPGSSEDNIIQWSVLWMENGKIDKCLCECSTHRHHESIVAQCYGGTVAIPIPHYYHLPLFCDLPRNVNVCIFLFLSPSLLHLPLPPFFLCITSVCYNYATLRMNVCMCVSVRMRILWNFTLIYSGFRRNKSVSHKSV